MSQHKYILNCDNYWYVKIRIGDKYERKIFNFTKYHGKRRALKKALEYRDNILKKYGLFNRLKYKKAPDKFRQKKELAVIGVYLTNHLNHNGTKTLYNWTVRYSINEKEVKRHFSVFKYGFKKAFQMACQLRYANSGELIIIDKDLCPEIPEVPYKIMN